MNEPQQQSPIKPRALYANNLNVIASQIKGKNEAGEDTIDIGVLAAWMQTELLLDIRDLLLTQAVQTGAATSGPAGLVIASAIPKGLKLT